MKKNLIVLTIIAAFVCTTVFFTSSGCGSGEPEHADTLQTEPPLETSISVAYATIPSDFVTQTQAAADTFSWLSFIALNWPAASNSCTADTTKSILTGGGPVVWETYLSTDQVFVVQGQQPATWCATGNANSLQHVPQHVLELGQKTGINRFIHLTAKATAESPHGLDQASGGPLVDQNGRFVRYEVRMNFDEYNYITTNNIWNAAGQKTFVADSNQFDLPTGPTGAMEFKAAWKILGANDDASAFYTIQAIVYNDDAEDPSPGPNPVTLGLVGLHIAHKTPTQGNWVWSTFEHVDNLTKSFYNPNCDTCPTNQPIPDQKNVVELNPDGSPAHSPTQVTRINPVEDPDVDGINTYFQGLLKGSVWANYELISTQWLLFEHVTPKYLANSVQETYLQEPSPASYGTYKLRIDEEYYKDPLYRPFSGQSSSSCMGCHYIATSAGIRSDFSFILNDAQ